MEQGFVKADSNNLPRVDYFMIHEYYMENMDYISAEYRNVKTLRAARSSYGDEAIGYVQLKREDDVVVVKGRIAPEHRVRLKPYEVCAKIDTKKEKILKSICEDCTASLGGCKHAVAFLYWLHRRSEEKSPTSVECYWNKPRLSKVGSSVTFLKAKDLIQEHSKKAKVSLKHPSQNVNVPGGFLDDFILKSIEKKCSSQLVNYFIDPPDVKKYLSLHFLMCDFKKTDIQLTPENFIIFCKTNMTEELCVRASKDTVLQSKSPLWYEIRYGRITASKLYEAASCTTPDGSLVESIFGAYSLPETDHMKRGRELESAVVKIVQRRYKSERFKNVGIVLNKNYPIFGASPDAISENFVVEVKCPSKQTTVKNYLKPNGTLSLKCLCQIYLQMLFCDKEKGLFCVASPKFEENEEVNIIEVRLNKMFLEVIINESMEFWKTNLFSKLIK